jgi:cyanophycin synthetase
MKSLSNKGRQTMVSFGHFISRWKWHLDLLRIFHYLRHGWSKYRNHAFDLKDLFSEFHEEIWQEAANKLSVDLVAYPGEFYRVRYGDRSTWIQSYRVQLDSHVTLDLARNKPLVSTLLSDNSIPVPPFHAFKFHDIGSAREFLHKQNVPCVVKPALASAGGKGVTTHVRTQRDLTRAVMFASAFDPLVMIERQIPGDVYRLLYLDGKLIDAIQRHPPHVIGDGQSTIRELIRAENKRRVEKSGHSALKVLVIDFDCRKTLRRSRITLDSVPERGRVVVVKTTTNESAAHECASVRKILDGELVRECARATKILGIRLAGVDVITPDVGLPLAQCGGAIIEVNASPGLHYHYQIRNPEDMVPVAVPILRHLLDIKEENEKTVQDLLIQQHLAPPP